MVTGFQKNSQNSSSINKIELKEKFKMEVPRKVWNQMMYLCEKQPGLEWSGVMFYKSTGSISDLPNFKVVAKDIFLKDIGSSTYTEYETDGSEVEFMMDNPEYMEYDMGKIHSHNRMGVFHSGTDWADLWDNSATHNYYLSFIVNNRGDVEVKIAWRTEEVKNESVYYVKDNKGRRIKRVIKEDVKVPVLVTADGEITVKGIEKPEQWFVDRYEQIEKESKPAPSKTYYGGYKAPVKEDVDADVEDHTPVDKFKSTYGGWKNPEAPGTTIITTGIPMTTGSFLADFISFGSTTSLDDAVSKIAKYSSSDYNNWVNAIAKVSYWETKLKKAFPGADRAKEIDLCGRCILLLSPYYEDENEYDVAHTVTEFLTVVSTDEVEAVETKLTIENATPETVKAANWWESADYAGNIID